MSRKQATIQSRYFIWRYSAADDPGNQLQKAVQEYIKQYQTLPFLVLVPEGLKLQAPIENLEVRQNELALPYRFYFALFKEDKEDENES